jgi:hypothetical protein
MAQIILDSNNNLIQGDFDNATLNNRTKLQTTTTNATTNVYVVPNGSSTSAGVSVANNSSLTNASKIVMATNGTTDTQIISGINGSGTYLPLSFYTNNALAMQLNTTQTTFYTGGTERMRIDSAGEVLVVKTSTDINAAGIRFASGVNAGYANLSFNASTNSDITLQIWSISAAANRFYVGMGGTVYATNTTITGISDQRVKENIIDLDEGLNAVMALKPRKFDWKEGKGKDIKGDRGFIAQEFETVFPDMIEEWKDTPPEGEEPYKAVNANLIPTLVKAIQEQQTIINELKTRIEALESK